METETQTKKVKRNASITIDRKSIKIGYAYGTLERIEFKTTVNGKRIHSWALLHGLKNSDGKLKTIHLGSEIIL